MHFHISGDTPFPIWLLSLIDPSYQLTKLSLSTCFKSIPPDLPQGPLKDVNPCKGQLSLRHQLVQP